MKNKKGKFLLISLLVTTLFLLGTCSAVGGATMSTPVDDGNYTTPITITVAVTANGDSLNMTNVTCFANSSGRGVLGGVYKVLQLINTSDGQLSFTGTAALTSGIRTYNISCQVSNGTSATRTLNSTLTVSAVTIDNTAPVVSITSDISQISIKRQAIISWSSSDATSQLKTSTITIISPDTVRCPTKSYSTAINSAILIDQETVCTGYYNATIYAEDYSGNSNRANVQFRVSAPDGKFIGEETIAPISDKGNNKIVIVLIIAFIIFLIWKSRK